MTQSTIQHLCVFCGANPGRNGAYINAAKQLGEYLASLNITLVYGGASIGLMGVLADSVLACDGNVIGVIPQNLVDKELAHPDLTECHIVDSMHARKQRMADLADGFILLPGGLGSLDEFFEILTWAQLQFHTKPRGILNVNAYYQPLIQLLDHILAEQFMSSSSRDNIIIDESPIGLLEKMKIQ